MKFTLLLSFFALAFSRESEAARLERLLRQILGPDAQRTSADDKFLALGSFVPLLGIDKAPGMQWGCSYSDPCGECQGDCDGNDDCEGDLICFEGYGADGSAPGCKSGGPLPPAKSGLHVSGWENRAIGFCVDPKKREAQANEGIWQGSRGVGSPNSYLCPGDFRAANSDDLSNYSADLYDTDPEPLVFGRPEAGTHNLDACSEKCKTDPECLVFSSYRNGGQCVLGKKAYDASDLDSELDVITCVKDLIAGEAAGEPLDTELRGLWDRLMRGAARGGRF